MLVLTRRVGEVVRIGEDVSIKVLGIHGRQIRVGISAPRDVPVHREEIYQRIAEESGGKGASDEPPIANKASSQMATKRRARQRQT